jgi:hypothetical protein
MPAGRPSGQISIENGRPLAGMNPGGMSARETNAISMMLAMSVRLHRLPEIKRISHHYSWWGILPAKAKRRAASAASVQHVRHPVLCRHE